MKKTAEMKIEISNARISNAIIMPDGTCKLELEMETVTSEKAKNGCIRVPASKLSLEDAFMKHKPESVAEKKFKDSLTKVIKNGIEDFYRPAMDPSFSDNEETKIHYMKGERPAVGKSYNWWKETVKDSKWCLGTSAQYIAFLGVLIKMLVFHGWAVSEAWGAVCNDSWMLGHYDNEAIDATSHLRNTGSKKVFNFFDLANTRKFLAEDGDSSVFWIASGCHRDKSNRSLAVMNWSKDCDANLGSCVAWLVLKK